MFEKVLSIALIIFSVLVWVGSGTFPDPQVNVLGPAFFPRILVVVLITLSIFLFFQKTKNQEDTTEDSKKGNLYFVLGLLTMILYVIVVPHIGFGVATAVFTLIWMWLMAVRKWILLVTVPVLLTAFVIITFEYLLRVPIPHGLIY